MRLEVTHVHVKGTLRLALQLSEDERPGVKGVHYVSEGPVRMVPLPRMCGFGDRWLRVDWPAGTVQADLWPPACTTLCGPPLFPPQSFDKEPELDFAIRPLGDSTLLQWLPGMWVASPPGGS